MLRTLFLASIFICSCLPVRQQSLPKIIGGDVVPNQKYFAGLIYDDPEWFFCGATFIEKRILLTAAHCVYEKSEEIRIRVGFDLNSQDYRILEVQSIEVHPKYTGDHEEGNDIAILIVEDYGPELDKHIEPLEIKKAPDSSSVNLTVVGFGNLTSVGTLYDNVLRKVIVPVMPLSECKSKFTEGQILDSMVCVGTKEGGKGSCHGDSGGPLYEELNGEKKLVGAVSYGAGCSQADVPGVYSNVYKFKDWIDQSISKWNSNLPISPSLLSSAYETSCFFQKNKEEVVEVEGERLQIKQVYQTNLPFSLSSKSSIADWKPVGNSCNVFISTTQNALSRFMIDPINKKSYLIIENQNQIYKKEVVLTARSLGMTCQSNNQVVRIDHKQSATVIAYKGSEYARLTNVFSDATNGLIEEKCDVDRASISLYKDPVTQKIKVMHFHGEVFSEQNDQYYEVDEFEKFKELDFKITRKDQKTNLTLENISFYDLYTWQLSCSFPYSLKYDGINYRSRLQGKRKHQLRFDHQISSLGYIKEADAIEFELKLLHGLRWDDVCEVNGYKFKMNQFM